MPKIPQVIREPERLGGPARPEDFGSGRGSAAIAEASAEVAEVNYRLFNEEMESRVSGAVGRAARELNTLQHEVEQIPDHNERTALYAKKSQKIISRIRESLTFPKFQGRFGERIEPTLERGRMSIAQGVRQSQIDTAKGERLLKIETDLDLFANAADPEHRKSIAEDIEVEIDDMVKGGLLSAEAAAKMKIAAQNRMEVDTLLMQSQVITDEIMAESADPLERIRLARSRHSGELEDQVVQRLMSRNHEESVSLREKESARTAGLLIRAHSTGEDRLTREEFLEIAEKDKLGPGVITKVLSAIGNAESGEISKEQYAIYGRALREMKNPATRGTYMKIDLYEAFGDRLDPSLIAKLQAEKEKGPVQIGADLETRIDRKLIRLGLPDSDEQLRDATDEGRFSDIDKSNLFRARVNAEILRRETKSGGKLDYTEEQAIIDQMADEIVLDNKPWYMLGDDEASVYQVTPDTETGWPPPEMEKQIRAAARQKGAPEDDATIRSAWRSMVMRKAGYPNQ